MYNWKIHEHYSNISVVHHLVSNYWMLMTNPSIISDCSLTDAWFPSVVNSPRWATFACSWWSSSRANINITECSVLRTCRSGAWWRQCCFHMEVTEECKRINVWVTAPCWLFYTETEVESEVTVWSWLSFDCSHILQGHTGIKTLPR